MKNFILSIHVFILAISTVQADHISLAEIREEFYEATIDSKIAVTLFQKIEKINDPSPLVLAYKGATQAILTKTVWNPITKLSLLKASRNNFNKAVIKDELNLEIRFLRFSVQHHIPVYLGFSKNLKEDKHHILNNLTQFSNLSLSKRVLNYIFKFLIDSERYTQEEVAMIKDQVGRT
ncbi:hypothetical protein QQ008_20680 [Fulvivirgaceae bacterium BMA10]|uniref:Uncharacterized protein n=1 Tax=Splendidivirga corallicola TaxID=3051826 RepID=A0ABT8KUI1_9BACT|nr:hypothetical protein [Fulvivirgaceae bacterium BMA10]